MLIISLIVSIHFLYVVGMLLYIKSKNTDPQVYWGTLAPSTMYLLEKSLVNEINKRLQDKCNYPF